MSAVITGCAATFTLLSNGAFAAEVGSSSALNTGTGSLVQMLLGLLVILAVVVGAAWLLRRYTPLRTGEGTIKIVGGLVLGARERMVLVEVSGVRVLVGITPGRLQTLHVFRDQPAVSNAVANSEHYD